MRSAPTMAPSLPMGQAAEHLQVKLRPDLIVQPQFYEGMTHYVVKDPIGLKYFRFKIEEYFLLQQFDGKQNFTFFAFGPPLPPIECSAPTSAM